MSVALSQSFLAQPKLIIAMAATNIIIHFFINHPSLLRKNKGFGFKDLGGNPSNLFEFNSKTK